MEKIFIIFLQIKINNFDCTKLESAQVCKILQNEQSMGNSTAIKLVVSKRPKSSVLLNEASCVVLSAHNAATNSANSLSEHRISNGSWDSQNSSTVNSSRATAL
jgi:hypothetical protein